jgi:hypothetical protein
MKRLTLKDFNKIAKILNYSETELRIIKQVKEVQIAPWLSDVKSPIDYLRHSTPEGVSAQLDEFYYQIGLLYLFTFDYERKSFSLSSFPVECNKLLETVTL